MEKIIKINENGDYFLKLLKSENEKLERLVNKAEFELENGRNLSEEICGKLRIAAGKAKLLMRKKFCQFEELCKQNLGYGPGEKLKVTNSDLAGYWDVVMIQVSQIHNIFEQCYELKKEKCQVNQLRSEVGALIRKRGAICTLTEGSIKPFTKLNATEEKYFKSYYTFFSVMNE